MSPKLADKTIDVFAAHRALNRSAQTMPMLAKLQTHTGEPGELDHSPGSFPLPEPARHANRDWFSGWAFFQSNG